MAKKVTIGIDIGGTKTRLALFDAKFRVLDSVKFKTHVERSEREFTEALVDGLSKLRKRVSEKGLDLAAVGVGACGSVDYKAGILKSSSVSFLKGYPITTFLGKKTHAPVLLGNDVHMGLYGEHQLGAAVGLQNVIGVFFGTGIGAAAIINGKLYKGASGKAGDIGHYMVAPLGPLTGSEAEGNLNDFASRAALAGKAAMLAARERAPYLYKSVGADVMKIRSGALADSIANGDKHVEELVRSRAHMAGIVLSNFVDFLNPEMVVLGGGLVEAMPALYLKEVEAGIRRHTVDEIQKECKVAVTQLKEYAVAAGAAKMAWDTFVAKEN